MRKTSAWILHAQLDIQCFGTYDAEKYQDISLDQEWRKWLFQVCTEWSVIAVPHRHGSHFRSQGLLLRRQP